MAALETPAHRRPDVVLPPLPSSSASSARRATVGSPPPYVFSNTFESHRPSSRNERLGFPHPYRIRRSTVSGQSTQGHNVNDALPLAAHGDANMMWSDSASPSPIMSNTMLPGASPTPSSSCDSPKIAHPNFDYDHPAFAHSLQSPIHSSFSLCPSPDYPSHLGHPRSMPPPFLPAHFSGSSSILPTTSCASGTTTTPALSPAASSTSFVVDQTLVPSNPSSPRHSDPSTSTLPHEEVGSEVARLRHRVRELEFINDLVRLRVAELESDNKTRVQNELGLNLQLNSDPTSSGNASSTFSFLNDLGPPPTDWQNRTAARLKRFCALNRAGNALCAWHDSRRERRAYPPRMAPHNTLNCGCTFSEALFEESLARNGVGAFYPGENVRMDPALRNPLLKLLEERYGYRDGDFERTTDGSWRDGEDAQCWEQRAAGTRASSKRER